MRIKNTNKLIVFGSVALFIIISSTIYWFRTSQIENEAITYKTYCGSCHLVPDPSNIPKEIWLNQVLPVMAKKMGYQSGEASFNLNNTFGNQSMIDHDNWQKIVNYIKRKAPDTIPNLESKPAHDLKSRFSTEFISNKNSMLSSIVHLHYTKQKRLFVGDSNGNLTELLNKGLSKSFNTPVISSIMDDSTMFITEIGTIEPSEMAAGALHSLKDGQLKTLMNELHRPVYTQIIDLNGDSNKEILICEFGNLTGQLSLITNENGQFEKKNLLGLPGSIKVEVADMNKDGNLDIVALFAQGKEGIYIFYQTNDLQFELDHVIEMSPEYGSSWFELFDYNHDDHLDILYVNGDNADYSEFLKPYHGVRIYINNGNNEFEEKWFYPINGATRSMIDDFDLDGDIDLAILAFFPDKQDHPEKGFIYFENLNSEDFQFNPYTSKETSAANWMVMDKGDFDDDGDMDIVLGGFSMDSPYQLDPNKLDNLLFLYNQTKIVAR